MIRVDKTYFNFRTRNLPFIRDLYGRWDDFCRVSFENIVEAVLLDYDNPDQVITIEKINLDLEIIPEENFDEKFACKLAEKLKEYLKNAFCPSGSPNICITPTDTYATGHTQFYMLYGYLPQGVASTRETSLAESITAMGKSHPEALQAFLLQEGHRTSLLRRLSWQLSDHLNHKIQNSGQTLKEQLSHPIACRAILQSLNEAEIYALTMLIFPQEAKTLISFARELEKAKDKEILEGKAGSDFRLIKWEFIYTVSLNTPSGHLERKYLVGRVLQQLAAHYGLKYEELLTLFFKIGSTLPFWLQKTLTELYTETAGSRLIHELQNRGNELSTIDVSEQELWRQLLTRPISGRNLLKQLKEKEIICLIKILFPSYAAFILSFREILLQIKNHLLPTEKTDRDFQLIEWESIFQLFLNQPFNKYTFVLSLLHSTAIHYGLTQQNIFDYCHTLRNQGCLPQELAEVFMQLPMATEKHKTQPESITEKHSSKERTDEEMLLNLQNRSMSSILQGIINNNDIRETSQKIPFYTCLLKSYSSQETIEIISYLLQFFPEFLIKIWNHTQTDQKEFQRFLIHAPSSLQWMWIQKIGNPALGKVAEEVFRLEKHLPFRLNQELLYSWLIKLTLKEYANFSLTELFARLYTWLFRSLNASQCNYLATINKNFPQNYPGLNRNIQQLKNICSTENTFSYNLKNKNMKISDKNAERIRIKNSGLVLLSPWFPSLFKIEKLIEECRFVTADKQMKAIFLLQEILYPDREEGFEESELVLNKILTGYPLSKPLPRNVILSEESKRTVQAMLSAIKDNWRVMRNTSVEGFRNTFLIREGFLNEHEDYWTLQVSTRACDILLDSLPWAYKLIKYPWTKKAIKVEWR